MNELAQRIFIWVFLQLHTIVSCSHLSAIFATETLQLWDLSFSATRQDLQVLLYRPAKHEALKHSYIDSFFFIKMWNVLCYLMFLSDNRFLFHFAALLSFTRPFRKRTFTSVAFSSLAIFSTNFKLKFGRYFSYQK